MVNFKNIIEGFSEYILHINNDLSKSRLNICKDCKLLTKTPLGYKCSDSKYLNPATNEMSLTYKEGSTHGCGCILEAKTRVKTEKCPLHKW